MEMLNAKNVETLTNFVELGNVQEDLGGVSLEKTNLKVKYLLGEMSKVNSIYSQVLSTVPGNVLMLNLQGKIISCSNGAETELCGCADTLKGKVLKDLSFWGENSRIPRALMEAMSYEQIYTTSFVQLNPNDTTTTWNVRIVPLYINGKMAGSVVYFMEQVRHFDLVPEKDEQMGRLIRLGKLATSVVHEVKNPMQSISALVQLMEYKYADNTDLLQSLKLINEELYRANDLLVEFLGYSRVDDQVGYYDLNKVIHDGLKLNLPLCKINHIKVVENLSGDLPQLNMDRNRIKQVVLNLVENSISAILEKQKENTGFEGVVTIGTGYDAQNQCCYFTCTDNGIGMSSETLANFQKPFFTTKETGTGMGAAVSKTIVKLHGGTMEFDSNKGEGSTFKVILPLVSNIDKNADLYEEIAKLEF